MNRFLQAEVILTLTVDQARLVSIAVHRGFLDAFTPAGSEMWLELDAVVATQCARQGVSL